jgi:mandelate racemase
VTADALTIRAVRTHAIVVPMRRPLGTSATRMTEAPFALVAIETAQGVTGRAYAYCYQPAAAPLVRRVIDVAAQSLLGESVAPAEIAGKLNARFKLVGVHGIVAMALAAIDVACWDALAIAAGEPLAVFLGAQRAAIPAYNSNGLSIASPDVLADEALELLEPGFRAVKIRLGRPDAAADIAAVATVRSAVGDAVALMADYNQALTVAEAISRGSSLRDAALEWLEEPVASDDLRGSAAVAAAIEPNVQIGENLYGPNAVATAVGLGASDCLMFDLMRIGGVSGWLAAARIAAEAGIPVSSHLYPEVSAHLLAATPTAQWLECVDWAEPFLETSFRLVDGAVESSPEPGCGLSWDEAALARYAIA